jgi:hypothetical protein
MEDLKSKRANSLVKAAIRLMLKGVIDKSKYTLNAALINRVMVHYVQDLDFLKKRYGIPDRAAMPKIAGLMAYSIVKFRPLVLTNGGEQNIKEFGANEFLAIYYGLCVCADLGNGCADENGLAGFIIANPYFEEWFRNFKYLLEERSYTAESLIMVFATLGFVLKNSYSAKT